MKMSMSTYIKGIPCKEKLEAAERIIKDCKIAGVEYPDGVDEIVEEEIKLPVEKIPSEYEDIWEIKVKDIPEGVETIRFINSY